MQGRIKNLVFDVGGVIILIGKINFIRFDKKLGLPAGTLENIVKTCSRRAVTDNRFDERRFFEKRFAGLLGWRDYNRILQLWFDTERLNTGLIRWIGSKRKNYRIILLTNYTVALTWRLKKKFRIAHYFDRIFNSVDIGITKPDPKIFKHFLKTIKAKAGECLFVDDQKKNIGAAKKLGFKTIWFKNNREFLAKARRLGI